MEFNFEGITLSGDLKLVKNSQKLVIFAHGSGSSRFSPRNQFVARKLNESGIGTLLFDLLTKEEDLEDNITREHRFNIPLLAKRLVGVTKYIHEKYPDYKIGLFGSSTGAAAALIASVSLQGIIYAIVSRGGRADLAEKILNQVKASTLLIVGGLDAQVIEMNEFALSKLECDKKLEVVKGATHLFEEEGKLEEVTDLTIQWMLKYLE